MAAEEIDSRPRRLGEVEISSRHRSLEAVVALEATGARGRATIDRPASFLHKASAGMATIAVSLMRVGVEAAVEAVADLEVETMLLGVDSRTRQLRRTIGRLYRFAVPTLRLG